jgi:hypothetical protein
MEITIEQALQNIQKACDAFMGTKQDHVILQESIKVIKDKLNAGESLQNS